MEIKISKPSTHQGKTQITYEVYYGLDADNWQKNYELTIEKWKDNKTWNVYKEEKQYIGNGMVCEKTYKYFGRDMTLRDAKKLCQQIIDEYVQWIA